MSDFATLLNEYTRRDSPRIHGILAKCYDKNGKEIYSKVSGYESLDPRAAPLKEDAVFKYTSATKLISSIALLQCIDDGLICIDEPLDKIVPELGRRIIKGLCPQTGDLVIEETQNRITPRHLLTHTSGLAYWFLDPLLMRWKQTAQGSRLSTSLMVHERCDNPLVFEPGQGWCYGVGLDWAGVIVKRLHGISLEEYMIEHIWKPVGLSAPFPTFCISSSAEYQTRLMAGAERAPDGGLRPYNFWQGDNAVDQDGGHGLSGTARDWLLVLADIVSDSPKLLKPETAALMFEPQIEKNSPAMPMLRQFRPAWELIAGPVPDDAINHGLGGVLVTEEFAALNQPRNLLGWGGAGNTVWFASKEKGVAGFFSTQLHPFSDPAVKQLVNAWKKDFWSSLPY
ncbi:uncharacterized protein PV09_08418 [Verruconis gallopava]|uniref:Beta-lactamase-related domain-containing protein n=1 Tax=Verruconis gallopava TaxID=253628 RepID=A0A0D1XCX3_9PEZI|nr:uncharacterized protein PV09_08418 [Verruconis gallopava]KIW00076.1 hypothetical protein PV09_08418 [Verruconis gallopava]